MVINTVCFFSKIRFNVYFLTKAVCIYAMILIVGCGTTQHQKLGVTDNRPVIYAGFAFTGNHADIGTNFKYSKAVNGDGERGELDKVFYEFFKENKGRLPNKLLFRDGTFDDKAASIQMAVTLTQELVAQDKIGNRHKLVINLIFQVMFLDFESKEVMGTFPLWVEYIDSSEEPFEENRIVELVGEIYSGDIPVFHDALKKRLGDIRLKSRLGSNIRLYAVVVKDSCRDQLPQRFCDGDRVSEAYRNLVAQQASALISSTLKVAMLPYAKDFANSQMAMNFSDGSKSNFTIPPATFGMALEVRGFKSPIRSKKISKPGRDWMLYPAFIGLTVYEPEFQTKYFSQAISPKTGRDVAGTWVTANRTNIDEFALYSESLKKIIITGLEVIKLDKKTEDILAKCR